MILIYNYGILKPMNNVKGFWHSNIVNFLPLNLFLFKKQNK